MADPERSWSWEIDEVYDPCYVATASARGISYIVYTGGPHGGGGMAGAQSYEELLANGPLNNMPPAIEAEVRAYARAILGDASRAFVRWELGVSQESSLASADEALAYVSAAVDDWTTVVTALSDDTTTVLFAGTLEAGDHRLELLAGFGRPWRQAAAPMAPCNVRVTCVPGTSTTVRCLVRRDHTFEVTTTTEP